MNSALDELFSSLPPGWRVIYLCYGCKHFRPKTFTCPAFPKGIPSDIMEGFMPHTTVFRNQVGEYVFEPKPDFKPSKLFRSVSDLTRRLFRPREDIIKWITYKGRRIPIFKKRPPTKTYKVLSQLLVVPSGGKSTAAASFRAVKRFSEFLEEKGSRWMTVDDPVWRKQVKRLEEWFAVDLKFYKKSGKMYLPQMIRIDRTLRKLERRFPGILSDVRMVCVPQPLDPMVTAFVSIDKAHLEAGSLYRSIAFQKRYFTEVSKYVGVLKDRSTYSKLQAVRALTVAHLDELLYAFKFVEHKGVIRSPIVTLVSSEQQGVRGLSSDLVAHEFGHILHNKHNKLEEFMLNVYAPYVGRCVKALPHHVVPAGMRLVRFTALYQKNAKFRNTVFTPYSLVDPFEGYAEAFKGYVNHPQVLKRKWPEAYEFFRKIEERGLG